MTVDGASGRTAAFEEQQAGVDFEETGRGAVAAPLSGPSATETAVVAAAAATHIAASRPPEGLQPTAARAAVEGAAGPTSAVVEMDIRRDHPAEECPREPGSTAGA